MIWTATLNVDKRRYRLGQFATPEEAAYAYDCEVRRRGLDRPMNGVPRPKASLPKVASLRGEIWRPFPGADATHRISNKGRVCTTPYVTRHGQRVLAKLRKITVSASGHRSVVISGRRYGVSRVMAQVFPGLSHGRKQPRHAETRFRESLASGLSP